MKKVIVKFDKCLFSFYKLGILLYLPKYVSCSGLIKRIAKPDDPVCSSGVKAGKGTETGRCWEQTELYS